jgi:hypothetical protein
MSQTTTTNTFQKYPAYKDSGVEWLGEIPIEWNTLPIRAIFEERNEKNDGPKTDFILSVTKDRGVIPITDPSMTRFMISLNQCVELVWHAFEDMSGGEIYVKKLNSINIVELARIISPKSKIQYIGIRAGEKIQEADYS